MNDRHRRMVEVLERHLQAERDRDLDGTMATLIANPRYTFPNGQSITGWQPVRDFYAKIFTRWLPRVVGRNGYNRWVNDSAIAMEHETHTRLDDGSVQIDRMVIVIPFEGDLMTGELTYGTRQLGELMERIMAD
ncbi:MAG: hypothetical protein ABW110_10190 [Steroidobacteraceae bacterium]